MLQRLPIRPLSSPSQPTWQKRATPFAPPRLLALAGYWLLAAILLAQAQTARAYSFIGTDSMTSAREWHTATLLPNGKVLVAGGHTGDFPNGSYPVSAELYDPATGTWTTTRGAPGYPRGRHTATLLLNGQVLVVGGAGSSGILNSAELYDPDTDNWTPTGSLNIPRGVHSATLLTNGSVLVVGGTRDGVGALASAEIYDPATGTWTNTGSMEIARCYPGAVLLPDGRVLVAAGAVGPRDAAALSSAEVYNPTTGTWTMTGALATARQVHSVTLLPDGTVLAAGGQDSSGNRLSSAELYQPVNGSWTPTGALVNNRKWHIAALLPSGKVLAAGGSGNSGYPAAAELYDPVAKTWTPDGALSTPRYWHTGTLLPNGNVLIAGGGISDDPAYDSAELYNSPPGTVTPVTFVMATRLPTGAFHFGFANTPSLSFTVVAHSNLSLPAGNWTVLGGAMEFSPGQYQFTDTQATNTQQGFYKVRSP